MIRSEKAAPGSNTLRNWAAELETLDEQIEALQDSKKEFYGAIRDDHGKVTADALKAAMKLRRMDGEKRAKADEIDAETARILSILESEPRAPRATRAREIIEEITPAPPFPGADDGQRSIPSSDADGAKMDGVGALSPERADDLSGHLNVQSEQAVEKFEPPAFLVKEAKPLRPFCLKPDLCGGYGKNHCHECLKAAGKIEVSA